MANDTWTIRAAVRGYACLLLIFAQSIAAQQQSIGDQVVHIDDPRALSQLEERGFDLARLAFAAPKRADTNADLAKLTPYAAIVQSLSSDLAERKSADRHLSTTMKSPHRLFDRGWLESRHAFFELVGIVSRLDRAVFRVKSCGELRFIYRLAYRKGAPGAAVYSRLPLTLNVVSWAPASDAPICHAAAELWAKFREKAYLRTMGLVPPITATPADLGALDLKSIEVNMQSVRWPSTVRPDMGGYAEYLLRVFVRDANRMRLSPLENSPDVSSIKKNAKVHAKLKAWLSDPLHLQEIDDGTLNVPEEFLATRATSFALHGGHRLGNAPFRQLYSEADFAGVNFTKYRNVRSAHGLLKRLNDMSCAGCHQGRAVAGFHFLGRDRSETSPVNAIAVAASPHFFGDLARREEFLRRLSARQPPDHKRPFSVRAESEGVYGSHCGLGDPSFAEWGCGPGLECQAVIADDTVSRTGVCLPKTPTAGSACVFGKMQTFSNPLRDRVTRTKARACASGEICEDTRVGFPGGMCAGSCTSGAADKICGSIALLQGFNECLAREKAPFSVCLEQNVRPAALRHCDDRQFSCRDDYVCARTGSGGGACIPPYFLFQLRVDGHGAS